MSYARFARKESDTPALHSKAARSSVSGGLRIGQPNDAYEQEADCVANEVLSGGTAKRHWSLLGPGSGASLQRKCSCGAPGGSGGECEQCKQEKKEKTLQRKDAGPVQSGIAPPIVHEVLNSPGQPLDRATRDFFEPRFGQIVPHYDFSPVRIHASQAAAASARAVNALAYTVGRDMVFGAGQYTPNTAEGRRLIAHELMHVIQQAAAGARQGAVLQRQTGRTQGPTNNPCPSSTGIDTFRQFSHSNLPPTEQVKFRTYLGMLVRHDLSPGPDHTGHCAQEELSLVKTDCPTSMTTALASCTKSDCLPVNRPGQDKHTGTSLPSNRKAFLDLHRTTSGRSILEGTGKSSCRVICEQKYHCDTLGSPGLGVFRITRNFRADTFTPPGGSPQHITTGEIEKVESFGKGDFPMRTLPKGTEYA